MKRIFIGAALLTALAACKNDSGNPKTETPGTPAPAQEVAADPQQLKDSLAQQAPPAPPRQDSMMIRQDKMLYEKDQNARMTLAELKKLEKSTVKATVNGKACTIDIYKKDGKRVYVKAAFDGGSDEFFLDETGSLYYTFHISRNNNVNGTGQVSLTEKKFFVTKEGLALLGMQRSKTGTEKGADPDFGSQSFMPIHMDANVMKEPAKSFELYKPHLK